MQSCIHCSFYECAHSPNTSTQVMMSRLHAIGGDRLHTIAALLSVCVQHDDGQIHETHETTRTHRMVSAMVLFVFARPQDIHTKKKKRETNQRACPPGPSRSRTQTSRTFYGWGYIEMCIEGGDRDGMEAQNDWRAKNELKWWPGAWQVI